MSGRLSRQQTHKIMIKKKNENNTSVKKVPETYSAFEEKSRSDHERRSYSAPSTSNIQRSIYKALFPTGFSKTSIEPSSDNKHKHIKKRESNNENEETKQDMPDSMRRFLSRVNSGYGEKMMERLEKPTLFKRSCKSAEKIQEQRHVVCEEGCGDQEEKCFSDLMLEYIHKKIAEEEKSKAEISPRQSCDTFPLDRDTLPSLHVCQSNHCDTGNRQNAPRSILSHSKFQEIRRNPNSISQEPGGSDWKIKKLKEVERMRQHADKEAKMNVDKWCRLHVDYMEKSRQKARKQYLSSLTLPNKSSISMERVRQKQIEMIQKSYILNNVVPKGAKDKNGATQEPACVLEKDMEALIGSIPLCSDLKTEIQAPQEFGSFSTDSSEKEEDENSSICRSEEDDNSQVTETKSLAAEHAMSLNYEPENRSTRVDEYLRSYKAQSLDREKNEQRFQNNERKSSNKNYNKSHTSEIISKLSLSQNDIITSNEKTDSRNLHNKNEKKNNEQGKPFVYNTALPRQPWGDKILEDCRVVYTKQNQQTKSHSPRSPRSPRAVSPSSCTASLGRNHGNIPSPESPRKFGGRPMLKSVNLKNLPKRKNTVTTFTRSTSNVEVVPPIKASSSDGDCLDEKIGILRTKEFSHLQATKRQSYRKEHKSNQQSIPTNGSSSSDNAKGKKRVRFLEDDKERRHLLHGDSNKLTRHTDRHIDNNTSIDFKEKNSLTRRQQKAPEYDDEYGDPGGNIDLTGRQEHLERRDNLEYDTLSDLKRKASSNFERRFGFS